MLLDLEDVSKVYDDATERVEAVRDVSFTVDAGEIVVLLGPSGSGKSTLLLLAAGALRPDSGTVRFRGGDLAGLGRAAFSTHLRENVGIAYQSPQLLEGHDALSNAAIKLVSGPASFREARREALSVMGRLGLSARLGHRPSQLSGGEQRRVALARALVGNPALLLLDEPTANLDSVKVTEILDLVSQAAQDGVGVLLVTHDESVLRIASRVEELRDGRQVGRSGERAA